MSGSPQTGEQEHFMYLDVLPVKNPLSQYIEVVHRRDAATLQISPNYSSPHCSRNHHSLGEVELVSYRRLASLPTVTAHATVNRFDLATGVHTQNIESY